MRYLVLLLLLTGCASDMVKLREVSSVKITWIKQAPKNCGTASVAKGDQIHGCAQVGAEACVIFMAEDAPDWVVAHEIRHCFGYMHKTTG